MSLTWIMCIRSALSVGPLNSTITICPSFWSSDMFCTSAAANWLSERAVGEGSGMVVRYVTVTGGDVEGPPLLPVPEKRETQPLRNSSRQHKTTPYTFRFPVDQNLVRCFIAAHFSFTTCSTQIYGICPICRIKPSISIWPQ